jgi:hypothetical protein
MFQENLSSMSMLGIHKEKHLEPTVQDVIIIFIQLTIYSACTFKRGVSALLIQNLQRAEWIVLSRTDGISEICRS